MHELKQRNLIEPVMQAAKEKPFLGICMGLQVLMSHSEENRGVDCMDMYKGEVRFFGDAINRDASTEQLKIPHMGWNNVTQTISHPLWHGIKQGSRFYFVHSYYVDPEDESIVAGETGYDIVFTSAVACDNVFAVQFHPEKSAADGLQLLKNFTQWDGK
jgi:glutamine amidotransferase